MVELVNPNHYEKMAPIIDFMKSALNTPNPAKCNQVFQLAFPHVMIKKTIDGRFVYGATLSINAKSVAPPVFTDEDFIGDFSNVDFSDMSDEEEDIIIPPTKKKRTAPSFTVQHGKCFPLFLFFIIQ